jgi:hypothetical protein
LHPRVNLCEKVSADARRDVCVWQLFAAEVLDKLGVSGREIECAGETKEKGMKKQHQENWHFLLLQLKVLD